MHLRAIETATGDLAISWVRRSRQGWHWTDGTDVPIGEEAEHYRLVLTGPGFERIVETTASVHVYTAADRATDGPGPVTLTVRQVGSFALSRVASVLID